MAVCERPPARNTFDDNKKIVKENINTHTPEKKCGYAVKLSTQLFIILMYDLFRWTAGVTATNKLVIRGPR